ncbi:MAG: DUF484 family protein [Gammaproteobacteria bacterium]|nr:DUF484 family protein [Gammaproteobacteria bacterium]
MSGKPASSLPGDVDDPAVALYLQQHPDFFEHHGALLARLRLQHPRGAATVSLIERQVEVLRERAQAQEHRLAEFVRIARANDQLAERIHAFTRRLLRAPRRAAVVAAIQTGLREDLDTFHAVLLLAGTGGDEPDAGLLRHVAPDDASYRSFDTLFAAGKPRCGQVRDTQRSFLFGAEAASIGSVALVPLTGLEPPGLLALGSVERERFHPGMSVEFLARMGELITDALARA